MSSSAKVRSRLAALSLALVFAGFHAGGASARSAYASRSVHAENRERSERESGEQSDAGKVRTVVDLVNRHRAQIGCGRLIWDERLARIALRHSEDMARKDYFSHVDQDGRDPFDRMGDAGIIFRAAAENIAAGQTSGRQVFDDWMGSPGHRKNLENCMYTHHGIGLYRGNWTHMFARY